MSVAISLIEVEITCPDRASADAIARACVKARLAACANIVPGVVSIFHWQGKLDSAEEVLLRLKSRATLFPVLCQIVTDLHPYDQPAIMALEVRDAPDAVCDWILAETRDG